MLIKNAEKAQMNFINLLINITDAVEYMLLWINLLS